MSLSKAFSFLPDALPLPGKGRPAAGAPEGGAQIHTGHEKTEPLPAHRLRFIRLRAGDQLVRATVLRKLVYTLV